MATEMESVYPLAKEMDAVEYEQVWWPKLCSIVNQLIKQRPGDGSNRLSYEEAYSAVFRVVTHYYGNRLYSDLFAYLEHELRSMAEDLNTSPQQEFILKFHQFADQYLISLDSIIPVFSYLDRLHVKEHLKQDMRSQLLHLFYRTVIEPRQQRLFDGLSHAQVSPFTIPPHIMKKLANNLSNINPDLCELYPDVFNLFILPTPSMKVDDISAHIQQVKELQDSLQENESFSSQDQRSRKRKRKDSQQNMDVG